MAGFARALTMKVNLLNKNNTNLNFRGKTPEVFMQKRIKKFVDCYISSLADNLTNEVKAKIPKAIENVDGIDLPKKVGFFKNAVEGVRDLFELPFDLLDEIASRFPNSMLDRTQILAKYRDHALQENQLKALQGLYEDGKKFVEKFPKDYLAQISEKKGNCNSACKVVCNEVGRQFDVLLNQSMAFDKAIYDTKKERFIARLVSGFTAAVFLGNDFYNNAKLKGKTDEEAKKSQLLKQGQEVKENILEGLMQFGLLSCFSSFVNSNLWASALLGTAISMVSRVISRKSSGMRLTRVEVPEYSMNEFQKAVKNNEEYKSQSEIDKQAKKPALSIKNILLFCCASIVAGFSMHALRVNTKVGKNISEYISKCIAKINGLTTEPIYADAQEINALIKTLSKCGENGAVRKISYKMGSTKKYYIGEQQKTLKLFGKIEVPLVELLKIPLAPFRIVKEIVSYPYKIAKNLAKAAGILKEDSADILLEKSYVLNKLKELDIERLFKFEDGDFIKKSAFDKFLSDPTGSKNILLRYRQYEAKYGANPSKLEEEFIKYVEKMRLASLNNKTVSKVDNSKIAIIAQTTGTLSGMWFNMNDEYNAAIKNGDNKQEAQVAARKRGLNKFARMTSQVAISGALNSVFKRQYQGSMIGAGLIVALSTFLTDNVSRLMTAMPTKKMNKDELEKYQKEHKEGFMSWYYNLIDKLAR